MIPVIIPARMTSTRFPGKPLALIQGKEMILHVCERAASAVGHANVIVATDSPQVIAKARSAGFQAILTSERCATGTDRVAEAMRKLGLVSAINVQGDEPMIEPSLIRQVAKLLPQTPNVINAYAPLGPLEDPSRTSIPKVVMDLNSNLLYASRAPLPYNKSGSVTANGILKQICVYGFHLENLTPFGESSEKTPLETEEDIEILRFLENGIPVEMIRSVSQSIAVDYPEDITLVEKALESELDAKSFS